MAKAKAKDEFLAAITSVWWDIDDCEVPEHFDGKLVAENIRSALSDLGYSGAVSISAYGSNIPESVQHAGISLNHVPPEKKKLNLLENLTQWVIHNPPRGNILLISGCSDFRIKLEGLLADGGYNVFSAESVLGIGLLAFDLNKLGEAEANFRAARDDIYKSSNCSVWWDMIACKVPADLDFDEIRNKISLALFNYIDFNGPISIFAYGDTDTKHNNSIPLPCGFKLISGCVDDIGERMLTDMLAWILANPAPAIILLVASDNSPLCDALIGTEYRAHFAQLSCPNPPYPTGKTLWNFSRLFAGRAPFFIDGKETSDDDLSKKLEDKYKAARTSVWWDLENCPIPLGVTGKDVVVKIEEAMVDLGYTSSSLITLFGSHKAITEANLDGVKERGIRIIELPGNEQGGSAQGGNAQGGNAQGGKGQGISYFKKSDVADKQIMTEMTTWAIKTGNPSPSNMLLISGDGDYYDLVTKLRGSQRVNFLLAGREEVTSSKLMAAAKTFWKWEDLVKGYKPKYSGISSHFLSDMAADNLAHHLQGRAQEEIVSDSSQAWHSNTSHPQPFAPFIRGPSTSEQEPTPQIDVPQHFPHAPVFAVDNSHFWVPTAHMQPQQQLNQLQLQHLQQLQQLQLQHLEQLRQQQLIHPMQLQQLLLLQKHELEQLQLKQLHQLQQVQLRQQQLIHPMQLQQLLLLQKHELEELQLKQLHQLQQLQLQQQLLLHPIQLQLQQQQGSFPNTHTAQYEYASPLIQQQLDPMQRQQQQGSFPNTHTAPTGPPNTHTAPTGPIEGASSLAQQQQPQLQQQQQLQQRKN